MKECELSFNLPLLFFSCSILPPCLESLSLESLWFSISRIRKNRIVWLFMVEKEALTCSFSVYRLLCKFPHFLLFSLSSLPNIPSFPSENDKDYIRVAGFSAAHEQGDSKFLWDHFVWTNMLWLCNMLVSGSLGKSSTGTLNTILATLP